MIVGLRYDSFAGSLMNAANSIGGQFTESLRTRFAFLTFRQVVAVRRAQGQPINGFELANLLERLRTECRLSLESMQHDTLKQIAHRHVFQLGGCLKYLQDSPFDPNTGLHSLHDDFGAPIYHANQRTTVRK